MQTIPVVLRRLALAVPFLLLTGCPAPPPAAGPQAGAPQAGGPGSAPQKTASAGGESAAGMQTHWGPADGIPLGGYMSLTGDIATFGTSSNKAMGLAVQELNAKGGVNGKLLSLTMEDSASKQEEAKNAARRLIDKDKVVCVIGEVASSLSLAVAPDCQQAQVPMVSPSSTNPEVTRKGNYIFRTCFTDDQQGAYVAKFALTKGYKRGVLLRDISSDYSKGQSKVIKERFTAGGGKIVGEEGYQQKQQDFSAILTKIQPLNPDVIFLPGYYTEAGLILKAAREMGIKAPFIGADGWDSPVLKQIAGDYVNSGCYFVDHYFKGENRPKVKDFVAAFKKAYNEEPDALAACAYDAVYIVADAIKRAGKAEPKAIRDALAGTRQFDGVTGVITIDAERNASKPCVVLTFKNGEQALETTLKPADIGAKS